ncbi:MAG: BNR-4 repeat-containing protein [Verrucomicrobiota bacterium JB024]|nr:BNR-4 repeat-containing protein [Verrucomicrobiota bacterium JB024]
MKNLPILMCKPRLCLNAGLLSVFLSLPLSGVAQETSLTPLPNAGFENGLEGWTRPTSDQGMSTVTSGAAHSGTAGLRVADASTQGGSELVSTLVPAAAGQTYRLKFWGRITSGNGMAVFLVFYNASRQPLNAQKYGNEIVTTLESRFPEWKPYEMEGIAPEGTAYVGVRVHSIVAKEVVAELDDFSLEQVDREAEARRLAVIAREQLEPFPATVIKQWNQSHPEATLAVSDITPVCADFRVGFALLTDGDWQYIGFYNPERQMTIGRRHLGENAWEFKVLPSKVGYDNHNFIALALDADGCLHVSGNMHAQPLVYFRASVPYDIQSLEPINTMTGKAEDRVTYPRFYTLADGRLVYSYRQGASDDGKMYFNVYDTQTQRWSRLFEGPLFDGEGTRNAYPIQLGPVLGEDGTFHLSWVWREERYCETNHDLSYARSRDLKHWETVSGDPIELPLTVDTPGVVVDPVPVRGGIINGTGQVGFAPDGELTIAYHKYDADGNTQMYIAQFKDGAWIHTQASDWDYRWDFFGDGSIPFEVFIGKPQVIDGKFGAFIRHIKYGDGFYLIDPQTLQLGERVPGSEMPWDNLPLPAQLYEAKSSFPGMQVNWTQDLGNPPAGVRDMLRWESLPTNRDKPPTQSPPPPSMLRLVSLKKNES